MRFLCRLALAGAAALIGASSTYGSFTTVNPPTGEETHPEILSFIYGGTFQPVVPGSRDFTNGTLTATRIEDVYQAAIPAADLVSPLAVGDGTVGLDDQLWQADYRVASAKARYAVFDQNFGYFDGASGGTYHKLFDETGWGYNVGGSADLSSLSGQLLRWARGGEGRVVSSQQSDNQDGLDHMVTYRIDDQSAIVRDSQQLPLTTWLIFFEDKFKGEQGADFDFNDLVVEIKAAPLIVPEPASTVTMMSAGLMALAARRRRSSR